MKNRNKFVAALGVFFLVGAILVCLGTPTLSANTEETKVGKVEIEEQLEERLEILDQIKGQFTLAAYLVEYDYRINYLYSVDHIYSYGVVEVVIVDFYLGAEMIHAQQYLIVGQGEEIFMVQWKRYIRARTITYEVEKKEDVLEYKPNFLPKEKAKELFEKARQHYLKVRRWVGVSTNKGLKKEIEEFKKFIEKLEFK